MKQAKMKSETIVARMFEAASERKQSLLDSGKNVPDELTKKNGILDNFDVNGNSYREFLHAVNNTKTFIDFSLFTTILAKHHFSGANDSQYMQAKTVEKVIKAIKAFGFKDAKKFDNHTRYVMINTLVLNGIISNKNAFATLTRVEFDALEEQTVLKVRAQYTHGTANTQVSSTREMLRVLKLTDGIKGARDADIVLLDDAKANMIQYFEEFAKVLGISDVPETEEIDIEETEQ